MAILYCKPGASGLKEALVVQLASNEFSLSLCLSLHQSVNLPATHFYIFTSIPRTVNHLKVDITDIYRGTKTSQKDTQNTDIAGKC